MCGIAGLVDFSGRPAAEWMPVLERMHAAVEHRGPDDWGRVVLEGPAVRELSARGETRRARSRASGATVALAHSRLAILDLSDEAHQPMSSAGRCAWVVYNGEIYNYRAHRDGLRERGVALRSASDTEVLAELLALDGGAAPAALRGMFACGWWDDRAQRLWLIRDRFGIKPLVYARPAPELTLFASTPRALMASGLIASRARPDRTAEFLARGSVDVTGSFWEGIDAVAPGACVCADAGGASSREYWSLERALLQADSEASPARAARTVHRALLESVEAHLVSDVPVAIFLSGGIDSTAVLAAARQVTAGPIQTVTVSMPGSRLDESPRAKAIADRFGSDHVELSLDHVDVDAALDEFFGAMQAPSVDGFNTFLVARAARRAGVKVALSGIGGDELFGGYDSFTGVPRVAALCSAAGAAAPGLAALLRRWPSARAAKLGGVLEARPNTTAEVWWEYRRLFDDRDVRELAARGDGAAPKIPADLSAFSAIRLLELRHFLERQLLADADAFTMCRALELRTPLVDHRLVEAVAGAGRWRRNARESFKHALFRELPELTSPGALDRPKQGFVLPFDAWIRDALAQPGPPRLRDFAARIRQPRYAAFVERFRAGRLHWSRLWALYVLDRFGPSWHSA